ncbi:HARBI1 [Mytilus coruscus]|uniref:HARBI1 n=1 Tax=Mytilus coruscus TaxID=42192 RepID=A0A6J8E566_MYTCO|nr:HARBI1 [Mytilus coruscus]
MDKINPSVKIQGNGGLYIKKECIVSFGKNYHNLNPKNKAIFCMRPGLRYRKEAIQDHSKIQGLESYRTGRKYTESIPFSKRDKQQERICIRSTVYCIYLIVLVGQRRGGKHSIFKSLKVVGVTHVKHLNHSSAGSIREMFLSIGDIITKDLVQEVNMADSFGLMIDEVPDISLIEQLVCCIQAGCPTIHFLFTADLLKESDSAYAATNVKVIKEKLQNQGIDINLQRGTMRKTALTVEEQLSIALRFYASGSFLQVIGDTLGYDKSTKKDFISFPSCKADVDEVKLGFYEQADFPHVVGCIDCTHVRIQRPVEDEAAFVNRKNFSSINVQAVKGKGCEDLKHWMKSICYHLWWCASNCGEDKDILEERWISIVNHTVKIHSFEGKFFKQCAHTPFEPEVSDTKQWLVKGSKAHKLLKEVVLDKRLRKGIRQLNNFVIKEI